MIAWGAQLPVLLVALLIVFLPGWVALRGLGLRGLALIAAAPLFSIAASSLSAVALALVGVPWNVITWAAATALLVLGSWAVGKLLGKRSDDRRNSVLDRRLLVASIGIGAVIGLGSIITYIADPASVSQTNDAVFHMNAVRFILDTADASSLHVSAVIGGNGFYPAAWHAVVSIVVMATGTSISIAANILSVIIGGFVWTVGIAWLTRTVTGSTTIAGYAAVLSGTLHAFPLLMLQWGVLFPNALSIALLPAAVAIVVSSTPFRHEGGRSRAIAREGLLCSIAMAALALSQPAALLPWFAICGLWASNRIIQLRSRVGLLRGLIVIVLGWTAIGVVWVALSRGTSGSHWPAFRSEARALVDVLLNGQVLMPVAWAVSVLMLLGLCFAVRERALRWFALVWAGTAFLYVCVAAISFDPIRTYLLGAWYADPYRIAALAPVAVIPLAAIGFDLLVRIVMRGRQVSARGRVGALAVVTVAAAIIVLLRPIAMPAFLEGTYDRESRYASADDAFLTPDERALLEDLGNLVPADARVIGNPSTASGFGYFLSGIDVYPRTWSPPASDAWRILAADLRNVSEEPAVCEALHAYADPEYVLDFGLGEEGPGRYEMPGMTDFEGQAGFVRVSEVGDVSLWRITACDQ